VRGGKIIGHAGDGAVRLAGARISDSLDCDGATLRNDSGSALAADGLQVGLGMFLRSGFTATGVGDGGAVSLTGARIGGLNTGSSRATGWQEPGAAAERQA